MTQYRPFLPLSILLLTMAGSSAHALSPAATTFEQLQKTPANECGYQDKKLKGRAQAKGWDTPVLCRPNEGRNGGVNSSGANGSVHGTAQPPDNPPWRTGAPDAVSAATKNFTSSFPPWAGFPCQLPGGINLCGGGGDDGGASSSSGGPGGGTTDGSCPDGATDNPAAFGAKVAVTASPGAVPCGGVVPLTTYQMSLSANADSLLVTEHGYYNYWLYRRSGSSYMLVSPANATLPNQPCQTTQLMAPEQMPPISQMISFNSSNPNVSIELMPAGPQWVSTTSSTSSSGGTGGTTSTSTSSSGSGSSGSSGASSGGYVAQPTIPSDPLDPPPEPAKYLVVPVNFGANPPIPAGCDGGPQYYKPSTAVGDIVFESMQGSSCESSAAICQQLGIPIITTNQPGCTMTQSVPSTANGSCNTQLQITMLDRPNMLFPPGAAISAIPIAGMPNGMVTTVAGGRVDVRPGQIVRLGTGTFSFPSGGILGLANGNRLAMNGPAVVSSSGQVNLVNGGEVQTAAGTKISTYPDNTVTSPNALKPVQIRVNVGIDMPAGLIAPTSPNPTVRLPVTVR